MIELISVTEFKDTDRSRVEAVRRWGKNQEIQQLGTWAEELLKAGKNRQASRVIRIAEKMQKATKDEMVIVCTVGSRYVYGGQND